MMRITNLKYPNFNEEKKLWAKGFNFVAGLDEAGRGPLAGPVVAAAVTIKPNAKIILNGINDSKKLSEKKREELYKNIIKNKNIKWGIGIVSEKVIDKINILEATKLAMQEAIGNLTDKLLNHKVRYRGESDAVGKVDFLLLDGNFKLDLKPAAFRPKGYPGFGVPKQKSIIKGDQKVFSIAAASIIAKVTRDKIMQKMHKKYPQYKFDKHKGYGTALHFKMIKKYGPCAIHRKSFYHISKLNK